jgi:hypothetical protein
MWKALKTIADQWYVGRIVTSRGTILYPPATICATRHRPVPVHTGVTVEPGDTASTVIRKAIAQFPTYLGGWEDCQSELRVEVNDG